MNDAEIIRLYWERDERAIPATAAQYGKYCIAIAKNILGNREDNERFEIKPRKNRIRIGFP